MKIYNLPQLADMAPNGDYNLGPEELGCCSVTVLYAKLPPGAPPRTVDAGPDTDVMVLILKGTVKVTRKKSAFAAAAGEAFHVCEGTELSIENPGPEEAVMLTATGRKGASSGTSGGAGGGNRPREEACLEDGPVAEGGAETVPGEDKDEREEGGFIISRGDEDDRGLDLDGYDEY